VAPANAAESARRSRQPSPGVARGAAAEPGNRVSGVNPRQR